MTSLPNTLQHHQSQDQPEDRQPLDLLLNSSQMNVSANVVSPPPNVLSPRNRQIKEENSIPAATKVFAISLNGQMGQLLEGL